MSEAAEIDSCDKAGAGGGDLALMQKEITYVCYSSSMLVLSDDLHPMASSRELPPRQLETSETAWINWTTSASSTGCLDHVPSLMTYNEPATPFGKN